ncbi:MAG: hypothetical protein HZC29_07245 [Thaumarchaeota archaeon]|nr:hypothetical protein [Nitrososphaerota archaeon]
MSLEVTSEFIAENRKRGGPYSKEDRIKRQAEVYRLHFELSYSVPKIAELMKVNLKTIYNDVRALNKRLGIEWDQLGINSTIMKLVNRLELQRQRLVERLESAKTYADAMSTEKMIYEIDWRLLSFITKFNWDISRFTEATVAELNICAKKYETGNTWVAKKSVFCCSDETYRKIEELMKNDPKEKGFFP